MANVVQWDLGYRYAKGSYQKRLFVQPSVVGESVPMFQENFKNDDFILESEDTKFIGDLALRYSDMKFFSMNDDKSEALTTEPLMMTGLGYLCRNERSNLITGLPVKFYFNQKENMKNEIMKLNDKKKYKITIGGKMTIEVAPRFDDVKVTAQGFGIAMDYLLDNKGKIKDIAKAKKRILVVDLGFYTLNLVGVEALNIMKESNTVILGVDLAYKLLNQYIQQQFGKSPSRFELDQYVISGQYEGKDITPLIKKAFNNLAIQIQNEIESLNMHFDYYLIGGGAAHLIYDYLNLPNKLLTDQLAQIRGYENLGAKLW